MYLIVGLGNPEDKYTRTRHNMGFDCINKLSSLYDISVTKSDFKGIYGTGSMEGEKVILLKPQTFMNLSGESIVQVLNFFKLDISDLIVIYDDMDLEKGTIRIRKNGSSGSHNGMKSIVYSLGTENFTRIRIGIGRPEEEYSTVDYVINKLTDEEYKELEAGIEKATKAVVEIVKNGINASMNLYN